MLNEKVSQLLNDQVNKEFYSAYLYLQFSNFYVEQGLAGFANWYKVQAQEERDHAMLMLQYLQNNDVPVTLEAVAKPDAELIEDLRMQLNMLIQDPQKIRYEKKAHDEKQKQQARARARVIGADTEDQYRKLTAQIAEAYSRLDTNEYLTQRLRDEFKRQEPLSVFSWELYAHAVKEVRMQAGGRE